MSPDLNSLPDSPALQGGLAVPDTVQNGPSVGATTPSQAKQPNILFIMADQLTAPQLSMYNPESQILTPNLDALAAKSVQFDSAYCPSPLCAPSRMSLISGQLPMNIGAYDNAAQISSETPTYAHYLRLQGYQTVLAGKMHFVGDQLHGYETRLTSDIYPGDFGWVVNWDEPDNRLEWYHNASSILQAGVCVRSNQLDYDEEVMYRSTQYMYDYARKGDDRPFCLTVSTKEKSQKSCTRCTCRVGSAKDLDKGGGDVMSVSRYASAPLSKTVLVSQYPDRSPKTDRSSRALGLSHPPP